MYFAITPVQPYPKLSLPSWRQFLLLFSVFKQKSELTEEEKLIRKAQKNPRYYGSLYEKYYESIFIFINRRVDNLDLTADLTSNVFYAGLKNLKKYKFQGHPFSSWLYRIAVNEVNMYYRKKKGVFRHVNIDDNGLEVFFHEMNCDKEEFDKNKLITHFLEQLNPEELLFIELRFFEKRSFEEVAYIMGVKANNAKVKTYRVLNKLKKEVSVLNWEEFRWQR